jgi:hypothetical protein
MSHPALILDDRFRWATGEPVTASSIQLLTKSVCGLLLRLVAQSSDELLSAKTFFAAMLAWAEK